VDLFHKLHAFKSNLDRENMCHVLRNLIKKKIVFQIVFEFFGKIFLKCKLNYRLAWL